MLTKIFSNESLADKQVETTAVPAAAIAPGPLGEAEVEAQKAADEIFPEAAPKVVLFLKQLQSWQVDYPTRDIIY